MKCILGEKIQMTQFFGADGKAYAATVLEAMPSTVTQIKTKEKDGYAAVQLAAGDRRPSLISLPQKGHFAGRGNFRYSKEFPSAGDVVLGDVIKADVFSAGDVVTVSGVSKGKGFQGVVKRHGFHGGRRSHGQKHSEREAGSIGGSGGRAGGRVAKGMRMAGRMGSDRITVKNLTVLAVDSKENRILVKGAIPGRRGTFVEIVG